MVICYLCPYENNDDDDCDKNVSWFTQLMRMIVMKTKIKEGVRIPVLINKKCSFIICKSSFISLDLIYTPRQLSSILIIVRIVAGGDINSFVEFNFVKDFKVL